MKTAHVSTLDSLTATVADGGASPYSCGRALSFGDAVITHTKNETGALVRGENFATAYKEDSAARRIKNFPIPKIAEKRRSFKETDRWEGLVTQVSEDGVIATLSRRFQDFPAEEALIPWDEIDIADRDLALEGATFHWKVGYLQIEGQQLSVSHIEFRRIPNFSTRERSAAKAKAAEYASLFDA